MISQIQNVRHPTGRVTWFLQQIHGMKLQKEDRMLKYKTQDTRQMQ